ncbi:hypothetical protein KKH15_00550 [Patescibacteria group bacterium]|nr:hypothetical protein [Patescibacteria group bacterium]MBU1755149.1 hypothetical protein [Patescibacteria group bacterium]
MSIKKRKKWAYQNTTLLVISLVVLAVLIETPYVQAIVNHIGTYGYIGSFISGIFFVSTFTVAPASVVLFHLAEEYNPILIALTAGAGAVIGDVCLFRFFKDQIFQEFTPLLSRLKQRNVVALFRSPYFAWFTPVLGAIIIASPFPDEIGIGMMGLGKIKEWQFMILTYLLNTVGILIIVLVAQG